MFGKRLLINYVLTILKVIKLDKNEIDRKIERSEKSYGTL